MPCLGFRPRAAHRLLRFYDRPTNQTIEVQAAAIANWISAVHYCGKVVLVVNLKPFRHISKRLEPFTDRTHFHSNAVYRCVRMKEVFSRLTKNIILLSFNVRQLLMLFHFERTSKFITAYFRSSRPTVEADPSMDFWVPLRKV